MTPEQAAASAAGLAAWSPILVALIAGGFGIIKVWSVYLINKRVKDAELAKLLDKAVENSLGIIQQAAEGEVTRALSPAVEQAHVPDKLKPGVQYVLDHAAEAVERFDSTWTIGTMHAIADKITSRTGLAEIATNLAISAAATPVVAKPLEPVPATADPPAIITP